MTLIHEGNDIDRAIKELKLALPIVALQNVLEHREKKHGKTAELRRLVQLLKARQLVTEAA